MRVAVTGGAGAIGRYVMRALDEAGHEPVGVDRVAPTGSVAAYPFVACDLTDGAAAREALAGFEAVVHLAAIPNPQNDPAERVMAVNTSLTLNVLEAARANGIGRVVYGCSESATGWGIHEVELRPAYLPLDEAHPVCPHETYSLSKYFGEEMLANYCRAYGLEGISLRYAWVWTARDDAAARQIVARAREGVVADKPWLGAYIAPHDVAQGCALAVGYAFSSEQHPAFEAFFLTARDTYLPIPTLEAAARHWEPLPEIRDEALFAENPYASAFAIRKAERLLGYRPTHRWQDYEAWERL